MSRPCATRHFTTYIALVVCGGVSANSACARQLVHALMISRLDGCNSLQGDLPDTLLHCLYTKCAECLRQNVTWEGQVTTSMSHRCSGSSTGCAPKAASSAKYCYSHTSVCIIWVLSTCVIIARLLCASTETLVCWQVTSPSTRSTVLHRRTCILICCSNPLECTPTAEPCMHQPCTF